MDIKEKIVHKVEYALRNAYKLKYWGVHRNQVYVDFEKKYGFPLEKSKDTYSVPDALLDDFAKYLIRKRKLMVSLIGFGSGLPGGPVAYASLIADIEEYLRNLYNLSQELGYIYGIIPSPLTSENSENEPSLKDLNEETIKILALGFGAASVSTLSRELIYKVGEKEAKDILRKKVSDKIITKIAKEIGKKIGEKVTKQSVSKFVARAVPFIGGVVSGGLNYYSFNKISQKLVNDLKIIRDDYKEKLKEIEIEKNKIYP